MDVSRCLIPVILISAIVYSFGICAFSHSSSFGSSEVGLVVSSCASSEIRETTTAVNVTQSLDKNRCMLDCSGHLPCLKQDLICLFSAIYKISRQFNQAAN